MKDYLNLSTTKLIEQIAYYSDQSALDELLSKRKLFVFEEELYLLPNFLWKLRKKRFYIRENEERLEEKIDLVYDRTLNKFSILKPESKKDSIKGPYCNSQYLHLYKKILLIKTKKSQLEYEEEINKLFRNQILMHIKYSWREVRRDTDLSFRRYRWQVSGGVLELKRPFLINGHKFRTWLENNVGTPASTNKGERERIQRIINNHFGYRNILSIDNPKYSEDETATFIEPLEEIEKEYFKKNFYELIAKEKSDSLEKQRPAIRKIGKENLKKLVIKILEAHMEPSFKDIDIANEFKLSKATYSRFAGHDWHHKDESGGSNVVPDLWRNMAHVISQDHHFLEAAASLGIKDIIDIITKESE